MGRALRSIPTWAWLAAIVIASTSARALLARGLVAPFIMVDEVIWSELARGFAAAGKPLLRDQPHPGYSPVYPLLISPAYALFDNLPQAYAAVKTLNSFLMSLAALPAFFLARRVVSDRLALLAALLAVAVPSLAYTGTVMTENAFYPLFLLVALVLVRVLERPSPLLVVLLFGLVAVAFGTRVQAVALAPAILAAPLVLAVFERRGVRATIVRYGWLYGIAAGGAVVVLVAEILSGGLLGAYSPVGDRSYDAGQVLRYLWWHVAELSLYVLVVPLAALIVLVVRARTLDARLQAFLAATVSLTVCVLAIVAAFASEFSDRIEERNMFYVAPLFCIALLAWIERGAPRPPVLAAISAAVSARRRARDPLRSLPDDVGDHGHADAAPLLVSPGPDRTRLDQARRGGSRGRASPRRSSSSRGGMRSSSRCSCSASGSLRSGRSGGARTGSSSSRAARCSRASARADRDWVDATLPSGARAAFLWTGRTDRFTVNQNEFFNRALGPVYYVTDPTPGGLPETPVRVDPRSGRVTFEDGRPVRDRYLLADSSFEPDGRPLARDKGWGITLWRVRPPLVSASLITGLYPKDTWSGPTVTYTRRRCRSGRLTVSLSSDDRLFLEPQTVVARANGRVLGRARLRGNGPVALSVPVAARPGTTDCRIVYTVSPTAVPAEVTAGGNPDPRRLGAHFNRFLYTPSRR